jgi:tetratricopeptide (TPR) repeat protein
MSPVPEHPALPTAAADRVILFAGAAIVLAAGLAYASSFSVPFVFDDVPSILGNPTVRQLWPIWQALSPPADALGLPVGGRPLVNFSLAVNHALGGTAPAGYHAFNLAVHMAAALVLFGVVRRTLLSRPLRHEFGRTSLPFALAVASLWALHPLQTESVTYVCQRAESMMALCLLATLYAFIRSTTARASLGWQIAAVAACLTGMACKEVMVTAPLIVLLYDRTFVAGSWTDAWRLRGRFYLALATTWLLLAALVLGNVHRGGTAGFETGMTPWSYALTQAGAIVHYLQLSLWPHPLIFDYGFAVAQSISDVALPAVLVIALLTATFLALRRRPVLGFLGAWFFLILAPTSSVVPVATQTIAEHRMYLPLAAIIICVVLVLYWLAGRRAWFMCGVLVIAFGAATARRNLDYRTEIDLWRDTVSKRPGNSRAHGNLGILLYKSGHVDESLASFAQALRLRPDFPEARANLGSLFLGLGRPQEALIHTNEALRLKPDFPDAQSNRGLALKQLGRSDEAMQAFREVLRLHPNHLDAHHNLAIALLEGGELAEAIDHFATTLRLNPEFADAHSNLGVALMRAGRLPEAIPHFETALRLKPASVAAHENLAAARTQLTNNPGRP